MGVQVPELKQCVQSFHFIVLSSSLSSLLVLLLFREILLFVVFGAVEDAIRLRDDDLSLSFLSTFPRSQQNTI
jgi:hypothetical protein